jgi:hypothetical protein
MAAETRKPDFVGVATKAGLECSDGRTIMDDAFAHQDGLKVPLVWNHQHSDVTNTLGHAILRKVGGDMHCEGYFNDTPKAQHAKTAVIHEDIDSLSIWANKLVEKAKQVFHGSIKEVSLVLSGANSGALIQEINIAHGDYNETLENEAIVFTGLSFLSHADEEASTEEGGESVADILDTLTEKQKDAVGIALVEAIEARDAEHAEHTETDEEKAAREAAEAAANTETDEEKAAREAAEQKAAEAANNTNEGDLNHTEGTTDMTGRHTFEGAGKGGADVTLTHAQVQTILDDAKEGGKYKTVSESFLAHAVEYGVENIDFLFPDAKTIADSPEFVSRRMEWVSTLLSGARKVPFSRIKSMSADITHDEARAKGYVKGNMKKEEWFGLAQRETTPQTIYKKQKLDRDDIIDVTTIDIVSWLKAEMLVMLDEELARAALIGDGREVDDEDKIKEDKVRPIAFDDDFYTVKVAVPANVSPDGLVESLLRARKQFRGSGRPVMFTTTDILTDLLLDKDRMGRYQYETQAALETKLRVSAIVEVEVMEGTQTDDGELLAVLVNLSDYTFGADRGGATTMFEDFDIDFNQNKYLIERRQCGALTKFHSAIAVTRANGTGVDVSTGFVPTFVPATGVVTIPTKTGVKYYNSETDALLTAGAQSAIAAGATVSIEARPDAGYYFPHNTDDDWDFTRPSA